MSSKCDCITVGHAHRRHHEAHTAAMAAAVTADGCVFMFGSANGTPELWTMNEWDRVGVQSVQFSNSRRAAKHVQVFIILRDGTIFRAFSRLEPAQRAPGGLPFMPLAIR